MLFHLLSNDTSCLKARNNNEANTNKNDNQSSANKNESNSIITKIPSMSEINYLNYINSTRMGRKTLCNLTIPNPSNELNNSLKSTIFASLASNLASNQMAYLISPRDDDTTKSGPSLYDTLDKYYQICNNSIFLIEIQSKPKFYNLKINYLMVNKIDIFEKKSNLP